MKIRRIGILITLLAVWILSASGCVSIPTQKQVTVFADTSLKPVLDSAASTLQKQDNLTLHIRYGSTDALKKAIDSGIKADLLVLGGKSDTPNGSYTFGSPAVRALMSTHKVDNYINIAADSNGNAYSAAKLLSSKNYAAAQIVVDFLRSKQGVSVLTENAFTPV